MSGGSKSFSPLAVRFSDKSQTPTYLFVRPHNEDGSEVDGSKALFVTGLPVLYHPLTSALESLFSAFGEVLPVVVHPSQLSALVVFKAESSVRKVLKAAAKDSIVVSPLKESAQPCGLKSWMLEHKAKFPGNSVLKKQLDDWMEAFERREEEAKAAAKDAEEGWTVVNRKPGRRKTSDPEGAIAVGSISKAAAEALAARKPAKQLDNFYTHQKREKRRSQMLSLRQKFEEDKKKIAKMRASRKFKPY